MLKTRGFSDGRPCDHACMATHCIRIKTTIMGTSSVGAVGLSDCQTYCRTVGLSEGLSDCRTRSRQWQTVRERVAVDLLSDHCRNDCRNDCRTVGHCRNTVGHCRTTLSDCRTGAQARPSGMCGRVCSRLLPSSSNMSESGSAKSGKVCGCGQVCRMEASTFAREVGSADRAIVPKS